MDALTEITALLAATLARHADAVGAGPLLAAVSGGVDSTALALALARLRDQGRAPVHGFWLGHVDHGQHALAGDAARQVRRLAETLDVPLGERRLDLPHGASEACMRDARYAALLDIARDAAAPALATAHHRDDQAETVLMRALRGTGPRGLAGIPERRALADGVFLLRPLLAAPRDRLRAAVEAAGVTWVDDPTNTDLSHTRAAVRAVLLPDLLQRRPDAIDSLTRVADRARVAAVDAERGARRWLHENAEARAPWRVDLRGLEDASRPTRREAFRLLHLALVDAAPLQAWLRRMEQLSRAATAARLHETLLAERTRDGLILLDPRRSGDAPAGSIPLPADGVAVRFGTTEWTLRAHQEPTGRPSPRRLSALVDAAAAPRPWQLRTAKPGDVFAAHGLPRAVSLRSALRSRGVPRFDRARLPLVVDAADRIVWGPGLDVASFARLRPGVTHTAVTIEALPAPGGIALPQPSY